MVTVIGTLHGFHPAPMRMVRTSPCLHCGQHSVLTLDALRVDAYQAGHPVQVCFPEMDAAQRELLITGTHPACWDAMFPKHVEGSDSCECMDCLEA